MIKTCPICKKEFETDDFRRKYCTLDCYKKSKNNKNIEKTCPVCNKNFKTRHDEQIYCSHECAGEIRKIEKIKLVCPVCKKVFYKKQCNIKNVKGNPCCSLECSRKSRQKYKELDISCSKDRLHHIWYGMLKRCFNKQENAYKYYGGRGITVCEEWHGTDGFKRFMNWSLQNGYSDNLSIDRIDNDKGYFPNNCRWTNKITQANNTRSNVYVTFNDETHTIAEWSRILGIKYATLSQRITKLHWPVEYAFEVKKHERRKIERNEKGQFLSK
jgi:hypothetical protein